MSNDKPYSAHSASSTLRLGPSLTALLAIVVVNLALPTTASVGAQADNGSRHVLFTSLAKVTVPPGTKRLNIWLPLPDQDGDQRVSQEKLLSPTPYSSHQLDGDKNQYFYITFNHPTESTIELSAAADVTRTAASARPECECTLSKSSKRWLKNDLLVVVDDEIRKQSEEIVQAAKATTALEKARAIYYYVVNNTTYDKSGDGWGHGDLKFVCSSKHGNCTDFHALFIALCRAQNIPARFHMGLALPSSAGGSIDGYHCWAACLVDDQWLPVDASEASKQPQKKDYYFGHLDENRIEMTRGRDLVLKPHQSSGPLNYFVFPYAEADGVSVPVVHQYEFVDAPK